MKPLSTTEAAELLGVSTRMVRLYIDDGIKTPTGAVKLKATLLNPRNYLLKQSDVEKFKKMRDELKA